MNQHEKTSELLVAYALGDLSARGQADVESHVAQCPKCSDELKRIRALLNGTARIRGWSAGSETVEFARRAVLQAVQGRRIKQSTSRPTIGLEFIQRVTMTNRMAKLAALAAVVMVVLGGVTFWPGGNPENGKWWLGSPAAWGREVIAEMERIEALLYRQQMVFMNSGYVHICGNWRRIYQAADRSREDVYYGRSDGSTFGDNRPDSVLVEVKWNLPEGRDLKSYRISHEHECYAITTSEGAAYKRDPMKWLRSCVHMLDKADRQLGTRTFDGRECVGFEIDTSKDGVNPKGRTDRIWLDVETKLPVRVEYSNGRLILDQFKYHVQIPAEKFAPKIPDGFINAHPDEVRAAKERQRKELVVGTLSLVGERSGHSVSSAQGIDIAIDDSKLTVTKQPDGSFRAEIAIWNNGSRPLPQFGVNFYAGDPDKDGRLLARHAAGPIVPGDGWGEYNPGLELGPGENVISVIVDPDNKVDESDETNNKASQVIPGGQGRHKSESAEADIAINDKDLTVERQPDGRFTAILSIHNHGNTATPAFKVVFYAGDPGKKGRKVYPGHHGAGPIMPRGTWNEGSLPFTLNEGESEVFAIVDPDNRVEESDETNNKASRVIPGRQPKYKAGSAKVDIAIEDKDFEVIKESDGLFRAVIGIYNKGSAPSSKFGVYFYAGDPGKGGRLLATHGAGPIMPGDIWREGTHPHRLQPDENTISVVVDPDNRVEESDETNNKASQVIPGGQAKPRNESTRVDIAIGDRDLIVTKLSDRLFEAVIPIHNAGPMPLPRFKVYFYAGDPDKGGRLLSTQNAGPIKPGDSWLEGTHPHRLEPGEDIFSVVLDPDNRVEESNETNNKSSQILSTITSESEEVISVEAIRKLDLSGDDILEVEARALEDFNFPYYLFIPVGMNRHSPVHILVEPNNSGMVSDDPEVHQAKALTLVKRSYASKMARRLGVPLLVPTFPRPRPETHSWAYTHALDIDTLEIEEGQLKRVDLQLTAMIKYAQKLLSTNGFKINDKILIHGFSASAKFCNRYSYLHPEMVKAAAAGGVNGLPTLPVREWNGYELPFPIGIAGIERFTGKPFDERAFRNVAHYIYMGSSDRNDTLFSREAWRQEEADIIRKALAAEKMMPDRWEISRKIYRQQKLHAQLVTYNGVGHSIQSQMLDDVIDFFRANTGEKYVPIEPHRYSSVDPGNTAGKSDQTNNEASQEISPTAETKPADTDESEVPAEMVGTWFYDNPHGDDEQMAVFPDGRVVALYSNGHKDQTYIVNGFIELAEFNNARCRMAIQEDGSLVQYFDAYAKGKRWNRIAPEPHTNLLRSLDH